EAEGLEDALLHRDHTNQYQQGPPSVFARYVLGLADGHAVLRMAAVHQHIAPPVHQTGTEKGARSDRMSDVSTRHMLGLTRGAKKNIGPCVGSRSLASYLPTKFIIDCPGVPSTSVRASRLHVGAPSWCAIGKK